MLTFNNLQLNDSEIGIYAAIVLFQSGKCHFILFFYFIQSQVILLLAKMTNKKLTLIKKMIIFFNIHLSNQIRHQYFENVN